MSDVRELMKPLIAEARSKRMFLETTYQNILFSPNELEKAQSEGRFCWGPVNWSLVDPKKQLEDEAEAIAEIRKHNDEINRRIADGF